MISDFLTKEEPRLFLGTLAVIRRKSFKKVDEWGAFKTENLEATLGRNLAEIFSFPPASDVHDPLPTDLSVCVVIPKYQLGDVWSVELGIISFPVFWRLKIEVCARLYELKTNKTKSILSVTDKKVLKIGC